MVLCTYNLEFDALAVELDGTDLEVDSDSSNEGWGPCVVTEAKQETRLADTWNNGASRRRDKWQDNSQYYRQT